MHAITCTSFFYVDKPFIIVNIGLRLFMCVMFDRQKEKKKPEQNNFLRFFIIVIVKMTIAKTVKKKKKRKHLQFHFALRIQNFYFFFLLLAFVLFDLILFDPRNKNKFSFLTIFFFFEIWMHLS